MSHFSSNIPCGRPLVPQVLAFAQAHQITLEPGWKVEAARRVKQRVLEGKKFELTDKYLLSWTGLFERWNA